MLRPDRLFNIFLKKKTSFKSLRFNSVYKGFSRVFDPYKVLNVSGKDDFKVIKKKYYKLVNIYHPDKNNGTEVIYIYTHNIIYLQLLI